MSFNDRQLSVARQIVAACITLGRPDCTVAVATAIMVESSADSNNFVVGDISADTGQPSTSRGPLQQTLPYGPSRTVFLEAVRMFLFGGPDWPGQPRNPPYVGDADPQPPYTLTDPARPVWDRIQSVQKSEYRGTWNLRDNKVLPYAQNYHDAYPTAVQLLAAVGYQERTGMISENGHTAELECVTDYRPCYPGHYNDKPMNGPNGGPCGIGIHSVECDLVPRAIAGAQGSNNGLLGLDWINSPDVQSSVQFGVDPASITQCLSMGLQCWGCGNGNSFLVQFEQSGRADMSYNDWTSDLGMQQLHNSAKLSAGIIAYWAARGCIIPVQWATDAQIWDAYNNGTPCGFCYHSDVSRTVGGTTHTDPGDNWPGKPAGPYVPGQTDLSGDLFLPLVRQYLGQGAAPAPIHVPRSPVSVPILVEEDPMAAFSNADLVAAAEMGAESAIRTVLADRTLLNPKWGPKDPDNKQSILGVLSGLSLKGNSDWTRISGFVGVLNTLQQRVAMLYAKAGGK